MVGEDMSSAWSVEKVWDEYNQLRYTLSANSEAKIREMAREIVDAHLGHPTLFGPQVAPNGIYAFPIRRRHGYDNIEVRLLPDMERDLALDIAERQIREQWLEQT